MAARRIPTVCTIQRRWRVVSRFLGIRLWFGLRAMSPGGAFRSFLAGCFASLEDTSVVGLRAEKRWRVCPTCPPSRGWWNQRYSTAGK